MQDVEQETCILCAGKCRGHSLGHSHQWEPEAGSRAAISAMRQDTGIQISSEVLAFLKGIGPLDGVHFGEPHPTERGAFWWRKHLPSSMPRVPQCAGCEGNPAPENSPCAVCGMAMPDSFDRGWNAAIDELERQDGFGEWADAAKFMRQLKKDTAHPSPKQPIL